MNHLLLVVPEELKLAENESVDQKDDIVNGQDQEIVEKSEPPRLLTTLSEKVNYRPLDKKYCETCARKNNQYDDHLPH